jgi:hypothetical protein
LILSAEALAVTAPVGEAVGATVVAAIVAAPLLRVASLAFRWCQEGDRRFVLTGLALLAVVASVAVLAIAQVGR